jgi:hypothetical protein
MSFHCGIPGRREAANRESKSAKGQEARWQWVWIPTRALARAAGMAE